MKPDDLEKIFEEARAKISAADVNQLAKLDKMRAKLLELSTKQAQAVDQAISDAAARTAEFESRRQARKTQNTIKHDLMRSIAISFAEQAAEIDRICRDLEAS